MTEREIFKKFDILGEDELNTKSNKSIYVKNIIMANIIKHCRGEKKRRLRAIDGFRKKLMIPDYEISESIEHVVKSKIGTIFVNQKIHEEKSVRIFEIDPYFYEHYKKKCKLTTMIKNTYCLELIFIFTEHFLVVEIDIKGHTDTDLIFEEKIQKPLEKKLNCTFIRINTNKENYDTD